MRMRIKNRSDRAFPKPWCTIIFGNLKLKAMGLSFNVVFAKKFLIKTLIIII